LVSNPTKLLRPSDFYDVPIWRWDDGDDMNHPVLSPTQLPDSDSDVSIFAKFTTPKGDVIDGCVFGISRVFSVGIFGDNQIYILNINLADRSKIAIIKLIKCHPTMKTQSFNEFLPLKFTTCINQEPYADFSGRFDMALSD
jgi:hypothetical protein